MPATHTYAAALLLLLLPLLHAHTHTHTHTYTHTHTHTQIHTHTFFQYRYVLSHTERAPLPYPSTQLDRYLPSSDVHLTSLQQTPLWDHVCAADGEALDQNWSSRRTIFSCSWSRWTARQRVQRLLGAIPSIGGHWLEISPRPKLVGPWELGMMRG